MSTNKALGCTYTCDQGRGYSFAYDSDPLSYMTDGLAGGGTTYSPPEWHYAVWYYPNSPTFVIDLGKNIVLDYARVHFTVNQPALLYAPSQIFICVKGDGGSTWSNVSTYVQTTHWDTGNCYADGRYTSNLSMTGFTARYINAKCTLQVQSMVLSEIEIWGTDPVVIPNVSVNYLKARYRNRMDFKPISLG